MAITIANNLRIDKKSYLKRDEPVFQFIYCEHLVLLGHFYEQVETVGDKYMAVSGLPEPCQTHARCIARLALDMMDLGREVQVDGEQVVSLTIAGFFWVEAETICTTTLNNPNVQIL